MTWQWMSTFWQRDQREEGELLLILGETEGSIVPGTTEEPCKRRLRAPGAGPGLVQEDIDFASVTGQVMILIV